MTNNESCEFHGLILSEQVVGFSNFENWLSCDDQNLQGVRKLKVCGKTTKLGTTWFEVKNSIATPLHNHAFSRLWPEV